MAIQGKETINVGFPNQPQGSDSLYTAFNKIKNNFDTLFACASPYSTVTGNTGIFANPNSTAGTLDIFNTGVTGLSVSGNGITITGTSNGGVYTGNLILSFEGTGIGSVTSVEISSATLDISGTNPITTSGVINIDLPSSFSVTGNIEAGYILTDNLLYANGEPYSFSGNGTPGGSNTQVQYNNAGAFGSSANFTFDQTTNTLTVTNLITTTLSTTGNANVSNIGAGEGIFSGNIILGGGALTGANLVSANNITASGNISGNYFIGDGSLLTGVSASASGNTTEVQYNDSGSFGSSANFTFDQTTNTLSVTNVLADSSSVTGNIDVGNLSADGIITTSSNVSAGNVIVGSGAGGSIVGANLISANTFTSINLSATGNVDLGSVSNITISGGSSNNVLTTDGTGNLSWQPQVGTSNISNIVPNIIWDPIKSLMIFKAPNETIGNLGTLTSSSANINWNSHNNYYGLLSANVEFSFEGIETYDPPISMISSVTLYLQQDTVGNRSITWPITVKWPDGNVPIASTTANAIDIYTFLTFDAGTTIIGLQQVRGII